MDQPTPEWKRLTEQTEILNLALAIIRQMLGKLPLPIGLPRYDAGDSRGVCADFQRARALLSEQSPDLPEDDANLFDLLLVDWVIASELAALSYATGNAPAWRTDAIGIMLTRIAESVRAIVEDLPHMAYDPETDDPEPDEDQEE